MASAEFRRFGGTHIPRYAQAAVVKEDGAPAFVAKPDLRFFAGEIGQAEERLAFCVLVHEVVGDKAIDGLDAIAADVVAADAANMCHAGLLEGDGGVGRSYQALSHGVGWRCMWLSDGEIEVRITAEPGIL